MPRIDSDIARRLLDLLKGMDCSSFRHPHFFDLRTVKDGIERLEKAIAEGDEVARQVTE